MSGAQRERRRPTAHISSFAVHLDRSGAMPFDGAVPDVTIHEDERHLVDCNVAGLEDRGRRSHALSASASPLSRRLSLCLASGQERLADLSNSRENESETIPPASTSVRCMRREGDG